MNSFRAITLFVILLLAAGLVGGWQWYNIVLLLFGYSILLFWGSYRVDSQFFMPVICQGDKSGKKIAITFDDGPDSTLTPQVLDLLRKEKVPATFFVIGNKLNGQEALLQRAHTEGHIIGNHSFSHAPLFDLYSSKRMQQELAEVNAQLFYILHNRPRFFRPPYGVTNPNLAKAVRRTGMKAIGWNVRSLDTVTPDDDKLFERVMRSLQPGAILLFHDTMPVTLRILPQLIAGARELGYEWTSLDKLINEAPYE
ncbi:polysaccharide deacetylase family protein [Flavihumibacter petaseus]|uniref:Putative polysaccharide deacetylase n=1 Tax=Flavihumibacter petaseus NBRC 106054 TaxID=1220578 RepID=A0A0E9MWG5_9BACT|nr:polysaccharide deacetylase family protein [Flavihumibacter petaseus]GAO42082.1 putative polysaccharide deacetylase [Flavihumibacter petaseus NBRC 106054]